MTTIAAKTGYFITEEGEKIPLRDWMIHVDVVPDTYLMWNEPHEPGWTRVPEGWEKTYYSYKAYGEFHVYDYERYKNVCKGEVVLHVGDGSYYTAKVITKTFPDTFINRTWTFVSGQDPDLPIEFMTDGPVAYNVVK